MLTIARLRTRAWKCYEEEQELVLATTTYAIVARHERDKDRSNWLGKSSLLEAVDYALWGRLPKSCRAKKDWITRGAKSGEVEVELSDGGRVVRQLGIHGSEKLWWYPSATCGEQGVAYQDAAQEQIEKRIGISKDDFLTTCYFQQRQMARLLLCDPGPRMDLVAGWIRLGPLQECEAAASDTLAELTRRRDAKESERAALLAQVSDAFTRHCVTGLEELTSKATVARSKVTVAAADVSAARQEDEQSKERRTIEPHARRFVAIVDEGKRLKEALTPVVQDDELAAARERLRVAGERKGAADRDLGQKVRLTTGQFTGTCPLVGEVCPAKAFVEGGRGRNERNRLTAEEDSRKAGAEYETLAAQAARLQEASRRADQEGRRLADLREEAVRLKPSYQRWMALPDRGDSSVLKLVDAENRHADALRVAAALEIDQSRANDQTNRAAELAIEVERLNASAKTASAAAQLFGKTGAQREIAEGVLGEVERRAGDTFARCGIELGVRMVWSREGSGLAATCGACGQALPASAKVKECGRCGAARGANLVNKLDFEVSDRSGGAEDLAGGVLQLAASSWLREDRGSDWGVAMLDEPFGALDTSNRRAFAGHLPVILRESGFLQSFVIAHHAGILDALPARIEITSDGKRSTARVT